MAVNSGTGSRIVTFRLDAAMREKLDVLATSSDRKVAQLIRYAVSSYFETADRKMLSDNNVGEDVSVMKHTSARIPEALANQVDAHAENLGVTSSDIIRDAIALWLDSEAVEVVAAPVSNGLGGGDSLV